MELNRKGQRELRKLLWLSKQGQTRFQLRVTIGGVARTGHI